MSNQNLDKYDKQMILDLIKNIIEIGIKKHAWHLLIYIRHLAQ